MDHMHVTQYLMYRRLSFPDDSVDSVDRVMSGTRPTVIHGLQKTAGLYNALSYTSTTGIGRGRSRCAIITLASLMTLEHQSQNSKWSIPY